MADISIMFGQLMVLDHLLTYLPDNDTVQYLIAGGGGTGESGGGGAGGGGGGGLINSSSTFTPVSMQ